MFHPRLSQGISDTVWNGFDINKFIPTQEASTLSLTVKEKHSTVTINGKECDFQSTESRLIWICICMEWSVVATGETMTSMTCAKNGREIRAEMVTVSLFEIHMTCAKFITENVKEMGAILIEKANGIAENLERCREKS